MNRHKIIQNYKQNFFNQKTKINLQNTILKKKVYELSDK